MHIRKSLDSDLSDIISVELSAFDSTEEPELVKNLIADPTADPYLSLLAYEGEKAVGHILFTRAYLERNRSLLIYILAPLAVVPDYQRKGVGGKLVQEGLAILTNKKVDLVFVLGHQSYYPRFGFKPAGNYGFEAPYPIEEKNHDAWMVLGKGLRGDTVTQGKVECAKELDKPQFWHE